jgi:hypothetical protein
MPKQTLLGAAFIAVSAIALSPAGAAMDDAREISPQAVRLPGTGFDVAIGPAGIEAQPARIEPALLSAIVTWLSSTYDLSAAEKPPGIAFVPAKMMAILRHASVATTDRATHQAATGPSRQDSPNLVSLYDDEDKIIYLPLGWSGGTPAELSMLVHEMVHHLQNMAGLTFACPAAREKPAYRAQQDWLALFGRDLFEEFETDAFSLLVRTECAF